MSKERLAKKYAKEIANSLIENAIETAYIKGFEAGVASVQSQQIDIKDKALVDVKRNSTSESAIDKNYVDLGLPSGTLWAIHNRMYNSDFKNYARSYYDAKTRSIPNKKQIEELIRMSRIQFGENAWNGYVNIIGPNGRSLSIRKFGYKEHISNEVRFWVNDTVDVNNEALSAVISEDGSFKTDRIFTGYHMLLVYAKSFEQP